MLASSGSAAGVSPGSNRRRSSCSSARRPLAGQRRQLDDRRALGQPRDRAAERGERGPARLVRQRHDGAGALGDQAHHGLLGVRQVLEALHVQRRAVPGGHLAGQQVRRPRRGGAAHPTRPARRAAPTRPRTAAPGPRRRRRPTPRPRTRRDRRAPSRAGRTAGRARRGTARRRPRRRSCRAATPAIRRASSSRRRAGRQRRPVGSGQPDRPLEHAVERHHQAAQQHAALAAARARPATAPAAFGTTSRASPPPPGWPGDGGTAPPPSPRSRDRRSGRVAPAEDTSVEVAERVVHAPPRLVVEDDGRRHRLGRAAGAARPARGRPRRRCPPTPTASGTSQANRPEPSVGVVARIRSPNCATSASLTCCFVQPALALLVDEVADLVRGRRVRQVEARAADRAHHLGLDLVLRELRRGGHRRPARRRAAAAPTSASSRLTPGPPWRSRRAARRRRSGPGTTRRRGPRGRSRTSPGSRSRRSGPSPCRRRRAPARSRGRSASRRLRASSTTSLASMPTNTTPSLPCSAAMVASSGASSSHGSHHEAQKLTTTILPL